jgi:N-formylglutamate deformylase
MGSSMQHYTLHRGHLPLLISVPHHGTELPPEVAAQLLPDAQDSADSDHHVARLYSAAQGLGASLLVPRWSRYVIDLNRGADAKPLYPGQSETALVPLLRFSGAALYPSGAEPGPLEVQRRLDTYWRPYHHALLDELLRLRARFGAVLLWEGHSIPGECPMFFSGQLPDFNLGSADGRSCAAPVAAAVRSVLQTQQRFTHVCNGRFKGGFITRHYGRPELGMHALQLELAQRCYMDEATPQCFDASVAADCSNLVTQMLQSAITALG